MSDKGVNDLAKEHKLNQDHKREMNQKHKWALGEGFPTRGHPVGYLVYHIISRSIMFWEPETFSGSCGMFPESSNVFKGKY